MIPGSRIRVCHSSPSVKGKDTAKLQRSLQVAKDFPCSSITSSGALSARAAWLPLTKQTWLLGPTPSHPQLSFPDFSVRIKPRSGQPIEGPGLPGAPALHVQLTLCFLPYILKERAAAQALSPPPSSQSPPLRSPI